MRLFAELKKSMHHYHDINQLAQELEDFLAKFHKIVEANEANMQVRQDLQEKLQNLKALMIMDLVNRHLGGLDDSFNKQNVLGAIAKIAGELNDRYNLRDTDDAKWVDLKVQFFEYRCKNTQEVTELKKLEALAEFLRADYLAQKAKNSYKELVEEEKELHEMVENLKPEKYHAIGKGAQLIEEHYKAVHLMRDKLSLYREQGRTPLLRAYKRQFMYSGNPDRSALVVNKHGSKADTLEALTQTAQVFRKKHVVEQKVIESTARGEK